MTTLEQEIREAALAVLQDLDAAGTVRPGRVARLRAAVSTPLDHGVVLMQTQRALRDLRIAVGAYAAKHKVNVCDCGACEITRAALKQAEAVPEV